MRILNELYIGDPKLSKEKVEEDNKEDSKECY